MAEYRLVKAPECPRNAAGECGVCKHIQSRIGKKTHKFVLSKAKAHISLIFEDGNGCFVPLDCVEEVKMGFEVGKWYKIKPHWLKSGQIFKCTKVYDSGQADLEGREMPDGTKSDWMAIEGEVPAPPQAVTAPANQIFDSYALKKLQTENEALKTQIHNATAKWTEGAVKLLSLETNHKKLTAQLEACQRAYTEAVKVSNNRLDSEIEAYKQRDAALKDSAGWEKLYREQVDANRSTHDKYIFERKQLDKKVEELEERLLEAKMVSERRLEGMEGSKKQLDITKEHLENTNKELFRLRELENEVNVRKWYVLRRHELALLLADRAAGAFAGLFSRHMAAFGAVVVVCFTVFMVLMGFKHV